MVRLRKLYDDEEVEVYRAPDEAELERLVLESIKDAGRPLSWRELRALFSGIAGEDRLRKVLVKLIEEDRIIEMPDGTFGLPGMEKTYVPRSNTKRVRPLVPSKFRMRWGNLAAKIRRSGLTVDEAVKRLGYVPPLEGERTEEFGSELEEFGFEEDEF